MNNFMWWMLCSVALIMGQARTMAFLPLGRIAPQGAPASAWRVAANWERVKVGLTADEVVAILGEPERRFTGQWIYGSIKGPGGVVVFVGGKVVTTSRHGDWSKRAEEGHSREQAGTPGTEAGVDVPAVPDGLPGWFHRGRWDSVKIGASKEEVRAWLGEPSQVRADGAWCYFICEVRPATSHVMFDRDDRVAAIRVDDEVACLVAASMDLEGMFPKWLSPATWAALRSGMSAEEVRQCLGEPTEVERGRGKLKWVYAHSNGADRWTAEVGYDEPDFPELAWWNDVKSWRQVADAKASARESQEYGPLWASGDFWRRWVWRLEAEKAAQLGHWSGRTGDLVSWVSQNLDSAYNTGPLDVRWRTSELLGMPVWSAVSRTRNGVEVRLLTWGGETAPKTVRYGSIAGVSGLSDEQAWAHPWLHGWAMPSKEARTLLRGLGVPMLEWTRKGRGDSWRCVWSFGQTKIRWVWPGKTDAEPPSELDPLDLSSGAWIEDVAVADAVVTGESGRAQLGNYDVAREAGHGDPAVSPQRWANVSPGDGALWVLYLLGQPSSQWMDGDALVWQWGPWEVDGKRIKSGAVTFLGEMPLVVWKVEPPAVK